jgi:hypothetical protein
MKWTGGAISDRSLKRKSVQESRSLLGRRVCALGVVYVIDCAAHNSSTVFDCATHASTFAIVWGVLYPWLDIEL